MNSPVFAAIDAGDFGYGLSNWCSFETRCWQSAVKACMTEHLCPAIADLGFH